MHDASAVAVFDDPTATSASLESIDPPTFVAYAASPPNSPDPDADADVAASDSSATSDATAPSSSRGTASTTR